MRTRVTRRAAGIGALVTAVALVATACGGGGGGGGAAGGSNPLEHTSRGSLEQMVRTDGAPAEPTGTLRVGSWISNTSFDPVAVSLIQGQNLHAVYDPLFQIDADNQPVPWLVTEWDEPSDNSVRLTLRDDVVFHDGTPFDAAAVKVNLERAAQTTTSPNANMYSLIESVTVESEYVAVVEFTRPYPNFYYNMATPAGMMVSPTAIQEGTDLARQPAGSGGWRWDAAGFVEGSKQVYTANPDYWNPDAVRVETVEISILTDPTARLNAFTSGQIDVMSYVPDANKASVETAGTRVFSDLTIATSLAILDREGTVVPAFADERVRKAIGLLLDREGFNASVLGDSGLPAGGFASPTTEWHDESLDDRALNVERAKTLLAEAGYENGFSFDMPSTTSIATAVVAIQQMLAAGGIEMNIVELPPSEYSAAQRNGESPAAYLIPTAVDMDQWWTRSVSNNSPFNPFGLTDLGDLEQRYLDSLTLSGAERAPVMRELQAEVIERGVIFPLSLRSRIAAASESVVATQQPFFAPEDWSLRPHYLWLAG
ncbi:ABC transporter substrate-binding protein [Actinophytocola gossypii]|uniref:ABC transporter substrate-binding protein n=1 Tax=Actinophytocola gossypii TaxID=2812003 RepID=A0ABT2J323_9PSEU|nr:ABC transporter substrate-binding protein [Actinophytocola gossypii]MCT2582254.1 ABC transporter substrate-binding protein [Actinophytocola gossypii]